MSVERDNARGAKVAQRDTSANSLDYRLTDPHAFVNEAYYAMGGFSGKADSRKGEYSYIIKNPTENFFPTRIQMSIYFNFFKKFIDAKYTPIFKNTLKTFVETESNEKAIDHLYYDFVNNITGSGINKQDFTKTAIKMSLITDVSFVIMDIMDGDIIPYCYIMGSVDLVDYTIDKKGRLTSCVFQEKSIVEDDKEVKIRRYLGLDSFYLMSSIGNKKYTIVEESIRENTLGILPVYAMFSTLPDDIGNYRPIPSTYDIAAFCAYAYDKNSKLDYVIDKQAHSILALQGAIESVPNGVDNCLVIGESNNAVFEPRYLSSDSAMPTIHSLRLDQTTAIMFDLMSDSGVTVSQSVTTTESGVAKSYRFGATNDTLKQTTTILKSLDKWLYETFKVFTNDNSNWISYTEYPNDFSPQISMNITDAITTAEFFISNGLLENAADMMRRIRTIIDATASKEEEEGLILEINKKFLVAD